MKEMETKSARVSAGETPWMLDRRVPLAFVLALALQAATAIWWASAKERDAFFMDQRLGAIEALSARRNAEQMAEIERLARIEERLSALSQQLDRIEKNIKQR